MDDADIKLKMIANNRTCSGSFTLSGDDVVDAVLGSTAGEPPPPSSSVVPPAADPGPGPGGGGSGEPRLLRTNGACERAVCLRYGQLVTDLVDGRLLALLTTRYGASRSHIRQAKRYLGCEKVHLCALTWVIPSRRAA